MFFLFCGFYVRDIDFEFIRSTDLSVSGPRSSGDQGKSNVNRTIGLHIGPVRAYALPGHAHDKSFEQWHSMAAGARCIE